MLHPMSMRDVPVDYRRMFSGLDDVTPVAAEEPARRRGLFRRLRENLSKSRQALTEQIQAITFDPADEDVWEEIENALILADCGVPATAEIVGRLERQAASGGLVTAADLTDGLRRVVAELMSGAESRLDVSARPTVILVVGVNGTGKTTTIGKLSEHLRRAGATVVVGAGDTFRAAAVEQLETWAERAGADFVGATRGQDPAAVAYDAVSLDTPRSGDDGDTYAERVGSDDERYELVEYEAAIAPTLKALPARERLILHLRFNEDMTQSEIALLIGVSQMHVSRLIRKALERLRTVAAAA